MESKSEKTFNQRVAGSNPAAPTSFFNDLGGFLYRSNFFGYTPGILLAGGKGLSHL